MVTKVSALIGLLLASGKRLELDGTYQSGEQRDGLDY